MDRREFLKKSAIGIASVAAVSVLGKTVYDMIEENEEQTTNQINTNMKKIMIIDGGPRKNMNTAAMVEAFAEGAREAGAEVKVVRLYELEYTGCVSCLACKPPGCRTTTIAATRPRDISPPVLSTR